MCVRLIFVIFAADFCKDLDLLSLLLSPISESEADFVPFLKHISKVFRTAERGESPTSPLGRLRRPHPFHQAASPPGLNSDNRLDWPHRHILHIQQ